MNSSDDVLSFMDLLDLDEELVDDRLRSIIVRDNYSNKHLSWAIQLLKYKLLLNEKEESDCENDQESDFVVKLIKHMNETTVDDVCRVTNMVLNLHPSSIVCKSEHLLQQILENFDQKTLCAESDELKEESKNLSSLKLCDSILDAVIQNNMQLYLPFLETPLENLLLTSNDTLITHFLTNTVPRFVQCVSGYSILERLWDYLKQLKNDLRSTSLKVLSCLSNFYLPTCDAQGKMDFKSGIVHQIEFWSIILYGLRANDAGLRKISVYLMKRSIDCVSSLKTDTVVKSREVELFVWRVKDMHTLKQMWNCYFVLLDSLEEKQSNIVLPSLQLFGKISGIGDHWLQCVHGMGLTHDSAQVRLKCIEYRLDAKINNFEEVLTLLEAFNDLNMYDHPEEYGKLYTKLAKKCTDLKTLSYIFEAMPLLKWSPVPLYYLSCVLAELSVEDLTIEMTPDKITDIINDLLKIPCNNIAARKAIHVNISYFLGKNCIGFKWRDFARIYSTFKLESVPAAARKYNPLFISIRKKILLDSDKLSFFKLIGDSQNNIELGLLYLENNHEDLSLYLDAVCEKMAKIQDHVNRQYSSKYDCFHEAVYVAYLYSKTVDKENTAQKAINNVIVKEMRTILSYILTVATNEAILSIDETDLFFKGMRTLLQRCENNVEDILLQLYKTCIVMMKDKSSDLNCKVFCTYIVSNLTSNSLLNNHYRHEMMDLPGVLEIVNKFEFGYNQSKESIGRLKNVIFEKSCKMIHYLIADVHDTQRYFKEICYFIENIIECGGYGCLKWALKIVNKMLPFLSEETINSDLSQFIKKSWKEIEELKSNNQYSPCMKEFVDLITQDVLLRKAEYSNLILDYCNKIVEYGPMKNTPLYFLVRQLSSKDINSDYDLLVNVLAEIMLFAPVPRKDQRIAENVAVEILCKPEYGINQDQTGIHFNYQIKFISISILCKISELNIVRMVTSLVLEKVDKMLANKSMYHSQSQPHRTLAAAVQFLLLGALLKLEGRGGHEGHEASWALRLLGRMAHQPSVRVGLEWLVALHLYQQNVELNMDLLDHLKCNKIPVPSQFYILFWIMKHRLVNETHKEPEFEFVMATLLSHTMGPNFNVRLLAQYLASNLYNISPEKPSKYAYIMKMIQNTLKESSNDKNFMKLQKDYIANEFDIVTNLTPCFIYYFLPRYCDTSNNENVDVDYIRTVLNNVEVLLQRKDNTRDIKKEWGATHMSIEDVFKLDVTKNADISEATVDADIGTIQKKYIPWRNMSDIDVYEINKKRQSGSSLIVVASLVDKPPNLGGLARTAEVFGVRAYVVDSLRRLADKQFQGLSVSAERWINVEEVRPGPALRQYLLGRRAAGYTLVAAEQTSASRRLDTFTFPEKTLLLLGHEKEGVPCELLPLMGACVEVPQRGVVRSLNVHVAAALCVWEYARQHLL